MQNFSPIFDQQNLLIGCDLQSISCYLVAKVFTHQEKNFNEHLAIATAVETSLLNCSNKFT